MRITTPCSGALSPLGRSVLIVSCDYSRSISFSGSAFRCAGASISPGDGVARPSQGAPDFGVGALILQRAFSS
jgi:hypothetical protein